MHSAKVLLLILCCFTNSVLLFAQLKAGDIAPDAKIIDADEMFDFSDGVARVKKGDLWGLIDSSGNFIIPYSKRVLVTDSKAHLIIAKDLYSVNLKGEHTILINTKGKVLVPDISELTKIDDDGFANIRSKASYSINAAGLRIALNIPSLNMVNVGAFHDNLATYRDNLYSYINRSGSVVIKGSFDYAGPFNEGMAVVGKKNEFGEIRYGFIDTKGKLVIPYRYSLIPNNFYSGVALVEAKEKTEFDYAYINKSGDIVFKIKNLNKGAYNDAAHTNFHYAEWHDGIGGKTIYIDSTGKRIPFDEFAATFNLPKGASISLLYSSREIVDYQGSDGCYGYVNLLTKKVLPAIYYRSDFLVYDAESRRIRAATCTHPNSSVKKTDGYINPEGVFVIVQKGKDTF